MRFSLSSTRLRAQAMSSFWRDQQESMVKTDQWPIECLHEPLFPVNELVSVCVVEVCAGSAHLEDASRAGNNATRNLEYTYGLRWNWKAGDLDCWKCDRVSWAIQE